MHVGIDLGTTYSLIARVNQQGTPVLFPDMHESERFKTPSVLAVTSEGALVGQAVEEQLEDSPELPVARFVKLSMGDTQGGYVDAAGRNWPAECLSALILKKLCRDARAHTEEAIDGAVLGVPAQFTEQQRRATLASARLAGIPNVQLVEEPVAAAMYYATVHGRQEGTILVYDLGGGTFDATLLRSEQGRLDALATDGAADLGGKNFDEAIMDLIAGQFQSVHQFDPLADPAHAAQLRRYAESLKIKLSLPGKLQVRSSLLIGGRTQDVVLTRQQFDRLTAPLLERTVEVCRNLLRGAGLQWSQLTEVILVGGSTLLPAVEASLLQASGLPVERIRRHNPHMAIAYGAALLADARARAADAGQGGASPESSTSGAKSEQGMQVSRRISAFGLGFRVLDPHTGRHAVDEVIPRNSPIPSRGMRTYSLNRPGQQRLILEVLQVRPDAAPSSVGNFAFQIARPVTAQPVEVSLGYDDDGLITVTARNPLTGETAAREFGDNGSATPDQLAAWTELIAKTRLL